LNVSARRSKCCGCNLKALHPADSGSPRGFKPYHLTRCHFLSSPVSVCVSRVDCIFQIVRMMLIVVCPMHSTCPTHPVFFKFGRLCTIS
jgi:hypothetical protein